MAVSQEDKWKCTTCSCVWANDQDQCKACESWKPTLTEAEIQEKKDAPLKAFLGTGAGSAPKPTGFASLSSHTSSPAGGQTFKFGVAPAGGAFGGSTSQTGFGLGSAPSAPPALGGGFVFGSNTTTAAGSASSVFTAPAGPACPGFGRTSTAGTGFVLQANPGSDKHNRNLDPNKARVKHLEKRPDPVWGAPTSDVYVFGMGDCDQLGLGTEVTDRKKPSKLPPLTGQKVTQVCVGAMHNLAITATGAVHSWGNNDDGALGRQGEENAVLPVAALGGVSVVAGACGDCHSAVIDSSGEVWLWGSYKDSNGYIGFPDFEKPGKSVEGDKCRVPTKVPGVTGAVAVAAGDHHTAVVTSAGELFTWGQNSFGQLGVGERTAEPPAPKNDSAEEQQRVQAAVQSLKVAKKKYLHPNKVVFPCGQCTVGAVGCGGDALFVCVRTAAGWDTYGCGLNGDFQLGLGSQNEGEPTLKKITALSGVELTRICGGQKFSVALDVEGNVWSWGLAPCTGLNLSDPVERIKTPRKVPSEYFCGVRICGLKAGGSHVVAWGSGGEVFTWGFGESYQLGNVPRDVENFTDQEKQAAEGEDEATPYAVSSKQLSTRFVVGGDAGSNHTVVLAWDGGYGPAPGAAAPKRGADAVGPAPAAKRQRFSDEVLRVAREEFALRPVLPAELEYIL